MQEVLLGDGSNVIVYPFASSPSPLGCCSEAPPSGGAIPSGF